MATVAAVMIGRNSARYLVQCLDSVKDVVDYIVFLETGSEQYRYSTDNTEEIVRRYTEHFYQGEVEMIVVNGRPHIANYSECRNLSLEKPPEGVDVIFIIDTDEVLLDSELFKEAVEQIGRGDVDIVRCRTESETPRGLASGWHIRMWRRGLVHYEGRKHNQTIYDDRVAVGGISQMRLHHYGYNLTEAEMKHKWDVTVALLALQREEEPNNPFVVANLAQTYRCQWEWQKVVDLIDSYDHSVHTTHTGPRMVRDYIFALICLKQLDKAYMVCMKFLERYEDDIDGLYYLGVILERRGMPLESLLIFEKYIMALQKEKSNPQPSSWTINSWGAEKGAFSSIGMQILQGLRAGTLSLTDVKKKLTVGVRS